MLNFCLVCSDNIMIDCEPIPQSPTSRVGGQNILQRLATVLCGKEFEGSRKLCCEAAHAGERGFCHSVSNWGGGGGGVGQV